MLLLLVVAVITPPPFDQLLPVRGAVGYYWDGERTWDEFMHYPHSDGQGCDPSRGCCALNPRHILHMYTTVRVLPCLSPRSRE